MKAFWRELKENRIPYLFVTPFLLVFAVFVVAPILIAVGLSFTYFNMIEPPRWVGWSNYLALFLEDDVFLSCEEHPAAAITGPLSYALCFVFAWLINELKPKIRASSPCSSMLPASRRMPS